MSERLLESAMSQFECGRFNEALNILKGLSPNRLPSETRPLYFALSAELHQLTGNRAAALSDAHAALRTQQTTADLKSQCLNVLASICVDAGRPAEALGHLKASLAVARSGGNKLQVARTQIRLMAARADAGPEDSAAALWSDVHQNVVRAGQPHLTALFHITQARLLARRGVVARAKRHLSVATTILRDHPNTALEALLCLDASAVYGVAGDVENAINNAKNAIEASRESGYVRTYVAGLGNLGLLELQSGALEEAERHLSEAVPLAEDFAEMRAALNESLAQLQLLLGRPDKCAEALAAAQAAIAADSDSGPSWYEVSLYPTRIRLALAKGEFSRAVTLAEDAVALADSREDALLGVSFRLLRADALFRANWTQAGIECIRELLRSEARRSPGNVGLVSRLLGLAFAALGDQRSRQVYFGRSERIGAAVGDAWYKRDLEQDGSTLASTPGEEALRPRFEPLSLAAVAGLVDVASDREVLALETEALVKQSGLDALLVVGPLGEEALAERKSVYLSFGSTRGRDYFLRVSPGGNLLAELLATSLRTLVAAVCELDDHRKSERERTSLWPVEHDTEGSVGIFASPVMHELLAKLDQLARSPVPILITGETGVGKEIIARELHRRAFGPNAPFLPYNCKAVPADMLDGQLFGHRRGAFTGATENFPGVIRSAAGGTLLLDEIGELGMDIQPKLLRFLDSGEVHPIGEARPVQVGVRIVAATNVDLDRMVREGRFREDLYYRLNVVPLPVPALRERREEIPVLTEHFLDRYAREMRRAPLRVTDDALEYLLLYKWPGNVRQLANELRRIVALAPAGADLVPEMLSDEIRASRRTIDASLPAVGPNEIVVRIDQSLDEAFAHVERVMVERALAGHGGHLERAAAALGISRKGLFLKRKRLGLAG